MSLPASVRLKRTFDINGLRADLRKLAEFPIRPQGSPYHNGEWKGVGLHTPGGLWEWNRAPIAPYKETALLRRAPTIQRVLNSIPGPKFMVRLLHLMPGGEIYEHRDTCLNFEIGRVRLHVPIVTNRGIEFYLGGERMRWKPGELWYGDFSRPHRIVNATRTERVHLVIDVAPTRELLRLFPKDHGADQLRHGISLFEESARLSLSELSRFCCRVKIPTGLLTSSLSSKKRMLGAEIILVGKGLFLYIEGKPAYVLEPISEKTLTLQGVGRGVSAEFLWNSRGVSGIILHLNGLALGDGKTETILPYRQMKLRSIQPPS